VVTPGNEGHLQINLCELRLSVFTSILITEAACKLVVPVDTSGADKQLLRLLGGLRERVEQRLVVPKGIGKPDGRGNTCRNEELSGAFRR